MADLFNSGSPLPSSFWLRLQKRWDRWKPRDEMGDAGAGDIQGLVPPTTDDPCRCFHNVTASYCWYDLGFWGQGWQERHPGFSGGGQGWGHRQQGLWVSGGFTTQQFLGRHCFWGSWGVEKMPHGFFCCWSLEDIFLGFNRKEHVFSGWFLKVSVTHLIPAWRSTWRTSNTNTRRLIGQRWRYLRNDNSKQITFTL